MSTLRPGFEAARNRAACYLEYLSLFASAPASATRSACCDLEPSFQPSLSFNAKWKWRAEGEKTGLLLSSFPSLAAAWYLRRMSASAAVLAVVDDLANGLIGLDDFMGGRPLRPSRRAGCGRFQATATLIAARSPCSGHDFDLRTLDARPPTKRLVRSRRMSGRRAHLFEAGWHSRRRPLDPHKVAREPPPGRQTAKSLRTRSLR